MKSTPLTSPLLTSRPPVPVSFTDYIISSAFPYSLRNLDTCFHMMCTNLTSWPRMASTDDIRLRMQATLDTCVALRGAERPYAWYGWAMFELVAAMATYCVAVACGMLLLIVSCFMLLLSMCVSFCVVVCELNAALFTANCYLSVACRLFRFALNTESQMETSHELERSWFPEQAIQGNNVIDKLQDMSGDHSNLGCCGADDIFDEIDFSSKITEYFV